MDRFHIEGVPPYDGDYEIDLGGEFTNKELHTIKKVSGVRVLELQDAGDSGDNDLVVAFAVIALERAGYKVDVDVLWNAPVGKITFIEEAEESPPAETPEQSGSGNENPPSSGESSKADGDRQASVLSLTGSQHSETSASSGLKTSAS